MTTTLLNEPTTLSSEALAAFYDRPPLEILEDTQLPAAHGYLLEALERGEVRAAEATPGENTESQWQTVPWVKKAILLGFRAFPTAAMGSILGEIATPTFDRPAFPPRRLRREDEVRLVPGGSAIRRGAHIAPGVVIMPPAYINVGAWVGAGTMIDSHALVGSCAQIGRGVHLSAGAQVGGVLEPPGALPVVVEDSAFLGAQCGLFEGVLVRQGAVLAPGVQLTAATEIFDTVHERRWRGEVPEGAVVVPGSRPARGDYSRCLGLQLYAPIIVKYRDGSTDAATALEGALR